jgi:hypothetical protein
MWGNLHIAEASWSLSTGTSICLPCSEDEGDDARYYIEHCAAHSLTDSVT